MKIHIVQKGDTLWKIAKKYGVNFEELKKMNSQLSNPDMIMPGMKIKVPTAGGNIKKEASTVSPGASIKMGVKKEMPIKEYPIAKEKPKEAPISKKPAVKKEKPIKAPIISPVKEAPMVSPVKEAPIEQPKVPYIPKVPQQIIPEIDINNYYLMNMANVSVQQPAKVLPPQPTTILPEVKPVKEIPKVEQVSPVAETPICPDVGGQYQPMHPYMPDCYPIYDPCYQDPCYQAPVFQDPCYQAPVFQDPCYPGFQPMPHSQVQGAYMSAPQIPEGQMSIGQMPMEPGMMPGVESSGLFEESSSFMPQINPALQMPFPSQGPAMGGAGMPGPYYGEPAMNMPFQNQPSQQAKSMPYYPGYGQMPQTGPQMQGIMEEFESPESPYVPNQMSMTGQGYQPYPAKKDCGCGGPTASHQHGGFNPQQAGFGPPPGGFGQQAGFGPPPGGFGQQAGFGPPPGGFGQQAGFGPPPGGFGQQAGFGPPPGGFGQQAGFGPPPGGFGQQTGFGPPPGGFGQQAGFGPPPGGFGQQTGFGPPPGGFGQQAGFGPPPAGFGQQTGFGPPPAGFGQQTGFGPPPGGFGQQAEFGPPPTGFGPPQAGFDQPMFGGPMQGGGQGLPGQFGIQGARDLGYRYEESSEFNG